MRFGRGTARAAIATSVALLAMDAAAAADTLEVTKKTDPSLGQGCTNTNCSLREAVDSANAHPGPDRVILPDAGVYQLKQIGGGGNEVGDLDVLDGPLRIIHPGDGRATIDFNPPDDGFPDPFDRIFEVHSTAALKLKKIVVTDGGDPTTDPDGGGILASGNVTLVKTVVTGNESPTGYGGGIKTDGGAALKLRNSIVSNNHASKSGGGIHHNPVVQAPGALEITRARISGNRAGQSEGGGLYHSAGSRTESSITDSSFSNNRTDSEGGGIYVDTGPLTISGTTVNENRAGAQGGGMSVDSLGSLSVVNSTFADNRANDVGGGINGESDMSINAVTVARNVADADFAQPKRRAVLGGFGGGLFVTSGDEFEVENSLIALNRHGSGDLDDCTGTAGFVSLGQNLLSTADGCTGFGPNDIVDPNPRIGQLADNGGLTQTVALLPGSPAINKADPQSAPERDQRGRERQNPDIGAFELIGP